MAMGHIFCITKDKEMDINFRASNYDGMLDAIHADYAKDIGTEGSMPPMRWLREAMIKIGAEARDMEDGTGFSFSFRFMDAGGAKVLWFAPKLEKLKREAGEVSIGQAIRCAPSLDYILNQEHGDRVELYSGPDDTGQMPLTFDDFIRALEPDTDYYVLPNTVLMH